MTTKITSFPEPLPPLDPNKRTDDNVLATSKEIPVRSNPIDSLVDLRDFSSNFQRDSASINTKLSFVLSDLKNVTSKLDYTENKDLKYMKQKAIELQGEGNRLFRDKIPNVILGLERDNSHLESDITDITDRINRAETALQHRITKLEKQSDQLAEINLDKTSNNLIELSEEINHYRNIGHQLKKRIDEILEEQKACANLVVPIQKTFNRANILSYHEVFSRFQTNLEQKMMEITEYKIDFNRRIEEMLGMYSKMPDISILIPLFKKVVAQNHSVKNRIQKIVDEMKWMEDRVHATTDIMYDLMSPVVPEGKFSLRTLIDDWEEFTKNNLIVQSNVEEMTQKASQKRDETLWRLLDVEAKMDWVMGRLRVWESDIRAQVYEEKSFGESMDELEKNMNRLDELIEKKYGKENHSLFEAMKHIKEEILKPVKMDVRDIGKPPDYGTVDIEKVKISFPKLALTYPDTAMSVNAQVMNRLGPRRRAVMPQNVKSTDNHLKISFHENDATFRKKFNKVLLQYGKVFENKDKIENIIDFDKK